MNEAPPLPIAAPERVRATERVESPRGPLARKLHRRSLLERLGLRRPAAAREHAMLAKLRARGLPVPEPMELSLHGGPRGEDVLATRWVEGARDLVAAWDEIEADPKLRRRLASALARLVAALHEAGVVHRDLHAGNVLVGPQRGLLLVDFHRAGRAGVLPRALRCAAPLLRRFEPELDLLCLANSLSRRATAKDRLRFLRHYGRACWPADRAQRRARLAELARRARDFAHAFRLHHEKRCDGRGRAFVRLEAVRSRGAGRRDRCAAVLAALGQDPIGFAREHGRLVHAGGGAELRRVERAGLPFPLAVKVFDDRGPWKRTLRGSRARRAWLNHFRLEMAGLPAPAALLWLASPRLSRRPLSVLVTEFVDGAATLLERVASAGAAGARPLLDQLARALARMHDEGLSHRDLKAENLLVDERRGGLLFVDPDGVRRVREVGLRRAARDLMRLNASFPASGTVTWRDRRRFLAAYLRARRSGKPPLRELWRETARLTGRKWQHARTPR